MDVRLCVQRAEVLGKLNKYYCSQKHGHPVEDENLLWEHFVKSGGADDFAFRWAQAMGKDNRWFAGEFYDCRITDKEVLWEYYMTYRAGAEGQEQQTEVSAAV